MTEVALKLQCHDPNVQLRAEVVAVLEQAEERRMPLNTLQLTIRGKGWGGWSSLRGWPLLCLFMGFYVYKGRTARGMSVMWVGLDQPSEEPADAFITRGFVVIDTIDGRYYRRDRDRVGDRDDLFTSLRSRARVWVSFAWAVRTIRKLGSGLRLEVGSTYHMQ